MSNRQNGAEDIQNLTDIDLGIWRKDCFLPKKCGRKWILLDLWMTIKATKRMNIVGDWLASKLKTKVSKIVYLIFEFNIIHNKIDHT